MAKQKTTKLKSFFAGNRRKAFLNAWTHLRTRAGESRIKLDLHLPLLNQSVKGMDDAIGEAFTVMAKDQSKIESTSLNIEMEGFTLDIFSTGESKRRSVSSTGVRFHKLTLVAEGEGENRELNLHIIAYIPASIEVRDWAWTHLHKELYLEAVYSQSEMDFDGEADEESDTGKGGDDFDPDDEHEEKPAKKKSGPAELKAFHETQAKD